MSLVTVSVDPSRAAALAPSFGPSGDIWIPRSTLLALPTSGQAWDELRDDALASWGSADLSDMDSDHDVLTLAGALYAVRMNDVQTRDRVVDSIESAIGTEDGGRTLDLARNITGYVLAADLVGYRSPDFDAWLRSVRHEILPDGDVPFSLVTTHETRPNNWGTHAGAARIAVAAYLGDQSDLARASQVFRGYLGDRSAYAGFKFGDPTWQADPSAPVPINPRGAVKAGVRVDGAIVDDIRRCDCPVSSPAPHENYQWEAMQGIVTQATLLAANGYPDVWQWSDSAVHRAAAFLYEQARFPAEGDDTFSLYLIDAGLGTSYSVGHAARSGKSIGYTDWTHATGATSPTRATPPTPPPLAPGASVCFPLDSPSGSAGFVNLTPVLADRSGHGSLTSSSAAPIGGSNVNFGPGSTSPNVAVVPTGNDGNVCFHTSNHAQVHVIADHLGSITAGSFEAARDDGSPERRLDTRSHGVRIAAGSRSCFAVDGSPGDAAIVNLTPVQATASGHGVLTSSDSTTTMSASNVNYSPGSVEPNVAVAPIGSDGRVCFHASPGAAVHLVADHLGSISAGAYHAARPDGSPSRRLDTRSSATPVPAGGSRCFSVDGRPGDAVLINLTPVLATANGHGLLFSSDVATPPDASNVNYGPGTVRPNLAVAPIGADGTVCFRASQHSSVHLTTDVLGTVDESYFSWPNSTKSPERRLDTRRR